MRRRSLNDFRELRHLCHAILRVTPLKHVTTSPNNVDYYSCDTSKCVVWAGNAESAEFWVGTKHPSFFPLFSGISHTLHPTIKPLQCPDTPFLVVSEASPVCLCVRNNPYSYPAEYVSCEFKSQQERRRDAWRERGQRGAGPSFWGVKGAIRSQTATYTVLNVPEAHVYRRIR